MRLELYDALVVPIGDDPAQPWEDVRFLKMRKLRVHSLQVTTQALKDFLEARAPGLQVTVLELEDTLKIKAKFRGIPVSGEASVELQNSPRTLRVKILSLKLGPLPLPIALWPRSRTILINFEPNPETPFTIQLPGISLRGGMLSVP